MGDFMQSLKGVCISFIDPAGEVMDATSVVNIAECFSANDFWFHSPGDNGFVAFGATRCNQFFMPFSQAVTPKIWGVIGTWLAAGETRRLQITVGEEKSEADSLSGVLENLERILYTFSSMHSDKSI